MGVPLSRLHSQLTRLPGSGVVCAFYTIKLQKCLTCQVLARRKFSGIHGLSKKLGACQTTATPVVVHRRGRGRVSRLPRRRKNDPRIKRPTITGISSAAIATATTIATSTRTGPTGAIQMSTYKLRYPNPVLGVGGAVSALTSNRQMRVASASPKFPHSTTT